MAVKIDVLVTKKEIYSFKPKVANRKKWNVVNEIHVLNSFFLLLVFYRNSGIMKLEKISEKSFFFKGVNAVKENQI